MYFDVLWWFDTVEDGTFKKFWWFETGKSWKILTSDEDFDFDAEKRRRFWDDHPSHGSFDVTRT